MSGTGYVVARIPSSPTITSSNSAIFTEGHPATFTATALGYPAPTFSETGLLPSGITLSSGGVLSGTTTQSGTFHFTIDATNGVSPDATQSFTLIVTQLFQIWTSSLPDATPGQIYRQQLVAIGTGSDAILKWKKVLSLPTGLKLTPSGVLMGVPSAKLPPSSYQVTVEVTERAFTLEGAKRVKTLTTVQATIPLTVT
jgi:hypothetical protein